MSAGGAGAGRGGLGAVALAVTLSLALSVWGAIQLRSNAVLPRSVEPAALLPAEVDGAAARTPAELDYLVRLRDPGDALVLGPDRRAVGLVPEVEGVLFWVTLAGALAYAAVALFALAPHVRRPGVPSLLAGLLVAGLLIAIGGISPPRDGPGWVLPLVYAAGTAFLPALFVRFALAFPRPAAEGGRRKVLSRAVLGVAALVAAWNVLAWVHCFRERPPEGLHATVAPNYVLQASLVLGVAVGCSLLARGARRAPLAAERRQAWWILWGIAIGATPYLILRLVPRLLGGEDPPIPEAFDRIVEMTIPAAFAIAVVRERFLDIETIVRRSVLYAGLTVVGAAAFFAVGLAAGRGLGLAPEWASALAGLAAGLAALPLHDTAGRLVDRWLFGIHAREERALGDLDAALGGAPDQARAAEHVLRFVRTVLRPAAASVAVHGTDGIEVRGDHPPESVRLALASLPPDAASGTPYARAGATPATGVDLAWMPALEATGAVLAQPVARDGRVLGLLLLGARETGHAWVDEDLGLLATAADTAGRALERLALVQEAAAEGTARRGLAELDRRKSEFFARIAHDLRTPVAAVRWSVRNLLDGIPGALSEPQAEYLRGMDAATAHLGRLVENLVDVGRLQLGQAPPPPERVDLGAAVRQAALALRGLAARGEVRVVVGAVDGLPPVRAQTQAAAQIVVNLVDNAIKHAPPGSDVEVGIAAERDGFVALRVRDHGPGLPAEGREHLFDLFARGDKDSAGRPGGLGIGLYVVRRWVESFGGTATADDHPGGGAVFTCRLQAWTEETTA